MSFIFFFLLCNTPKNSKHTWNNIILMKIDFISLLIIFQISTNQLDPSWVKKKTDKNKSHSFCQFIHYKSSWGWTILRPPSGSWHSFSSCPYYPIREGTTSTLHPRCPPCPHSVESGPYLRNRSSKMNTLA